MDQSKIISTPATNGTVVYRHSHILDVISNRKKEMKVGVRVHVH